MGGGGGGHGPVMVYLTPQDLTGIRSSLLVTNGAMKTPDCLYGLSEDQKKQPAEAEQSILTLNFNSALT